MDLRLKAWNMMKEGEMLCLLVLAFVSAHHEPEALGRSRLGAVCRRAHSGFMRYLGPIGLASADGVFSDRMEMTLRQDAWRMLLRTMTAIKRALNREVYKVQDPDREYIH
ncbi:hypothetical protein BDV06DRAFT_96613 [Aspergillus oleicola]